MLVAGDGTVLAEDRNRVTTERDVTAHPELRLARWASQHLDIDARHAATMYTSCEHCAMCATAFYWAGLGRLVFAFSGPVFDQVGLTGIVGQDPATGRKAVRLSAFKRTLFP